MTLGQRIQELRKGRGFSQEKLGELLGVSRQAVSKWESDGGVPELDTLIAMSRIFGITVGQLLGVEQAPDDGVKECEGETLDTERMVEAVLRRYGEETKKENRPVPWKHWVVAGLCLLAVAFAVKSWVSGQIDLLYGNLDSVGARVSGLESSLNNRIWAMEQEIQNILNEQANLISDFQWSLAEFDLEQETVTLELTATLKNWTPGTQGQFVLDWTAEDGEGGAGQTESGWLDGPQFQAQITLPMHDEITVKLVLTDSEGVVMEQTLGGVFSGLSTGDFQLNLGFQCAVRKLNLSEWLVDAQVEIYPGRAVEAAQAELLILEDGVERWRMPVEVEPDSGAMPREANICESIGLELAYNDPERLTYVLRVTDNLGRVSELVQKHGEPGYAPAVPVS